MHLIGHERQSLNDVKLWSPDAGLVILLQGGPNALHFGFEPAHKHRPP